MITKVSDFTGQYFIPNVSEIGPNQENVGNQSELDIFINKYEPEALDTLMGYELAELFRAQLDDTSPDDFLSGAPQIWRDLLNGKDNYRGFREALTSYIFYKYYEDDQSQYTQLGEKELKGRNTKTVSYRPRAIKAWRNYYSLTIGNFAINNRFLFSNVSHKIAIFTSPFGLGIIHNQDSVYKSMYSYLKENNADFPEWKPIYFNNINVFDL